MIRSKREKRNECHNALLKSEFIKIQILETQTNST